MANNNVNIPIKDPYSSIKAAITRGINYHEESHKEQNKEKLNETTERYVAC